jgi:hypothetical protein
MSSLGEVLIKIRLEQGHRTSKAFYKYLESRSLECNYQYYVKIEKNLVLPSSNLVNQIAKASDRDNAERLIKAFCSDQFKSFSYMFESNEIAVTSNSPTKNSDSLQGQKTLTEKQVHALASNKENYHLFLMMTLARKPLEQKDLENFKSFKKAIVALKAENILIQNDEAIQAASTEFAFPKAETPALIKYYETFDLWDKEFEKKFSLETLVNKMMIRRISPRYLGLIQKQIEVLVDILRISDESDIRHNNQVIQLQINLCKGEIPG